MAVLMGLNGKPMVRSLPARTRSGSSLAGPFPPLWSDGSTWDAFGDHGPQSSRVVSYENLYRTQTAVAACVNKLTRVISGVSIKVVKVNGPDNKTPVTTPSNPLRKLISTPAPRRGELDLKQWLMISALVHGNGLLAKYREDSEGPPTALLPVKWQYTSAYAEQGGPVEWWSTAQTGQEAFFPVEDSVHLAWESPSGEIGTSPLEQLGTTIKLEDASQRYSTSSFSNAVRPAMAIVLPPTVNDSQEVVESIKAQVQATHGGVDQAFLTMVIGGGADIKQLSHSAAEAELIDQRRLNFEEVCRVYDLAPQILGDTQNSAYNTMSEVQKLLYRSTIMPWLDLFVNVFQTQVIEGEEEFSDHEIQFDFRDQLRGTPSEELAAAVQGVTNGIFAVNEVRQLLGMQKIDNEVFDEPMVPTNNLSPAGAEGDNRSDPNNPGGSRGGSAQAVERPSSQAPLRASSE